MCEGSTRRAAVSLAADDFIREFGFGDFTFFPTKRYWRGVKNRALFLENMICGDGRPRIPTEADACEDMEYSAANSGLS